MAKSLQKIAWKRTTAEEALQLMRTEPVDLVILDLVMPEVDGQTVLTRMADDPVLVDIPVILASATGQNQVEMHLSGSIQLFKSQGFELGDVVRMLDVMLKAVSPGWGHLAAREIERSEALAGSPA